MTNIFVVFGIGAFLITLILSIILFINKKRKTGIISIILSLFIGCSLAGGIMYYTYIYPKDIEYKMTIGTNITGEYTLFVPYIDNPKLRSVLAIVSGNGSFEFIRVNMTSINGSNRAIKVLGNGNMTIYGKTTVQSWCKLSLQNRGNGKSGIYWVWCNKTKTNQEIYIH